MCHQYLSTRAMLSRSLHVKREPALYQIGPGGSGETDDRQHEGEGESESDRHRSLAGRRIVDTPRENVKDDEV